MGVLTYLRGLKASTADQKEGGPPTANGSPEVSYPKKKWTTFLPIFVALVVVAEIAFLGRLDMAKNAAVLVDTWADTLFYKSPPVDSSDGEDSGLGLIGGGFLDGTLLPKHSRVTGEELEILLLRKGMNNRSSGSCEEWLEREDAVVYSRDFGKDPVFVTGGEKEWRTCAVGCHFGFSDSRTPDAAFGSPQQAGTSSVLRSMESARYYGENNITMARRRGYKIIMTTSLSSDVPVGYFSWAEYDIMAPVQLKTEKALAAAFISNCGALNFRLQALEALEKLKLEIDSYGGCHRNRDGRVNKVETLKRYKFSLAFENSNEEDYVTEKFFQSLVAGTIPVVIGAPNIEEFAPGPGSILHIKELEDVEKIAKTMRYLAENPGAYNHSLRWKYEGPSDSFKALIDMAAVHSSCRLCIHLATMIREREENSPGFKTRPCKCTNGSETVYHLYVRERGRFEMESIFLRSGNLTLKALESEVFKKFESIKHVPIWKQERPESIRGGDELRIYKIYPVGLTQKQALYTFKFDGDAGFQNHLETSPCAKFEVIFV